MPFTLGVNTASLAGYSSEDALSTAATLGFQAIELLAYEGATHSQGALPGLWFNDLDTSGKDRLLRLLEPFPSRSLLTCNKRTRENAIAKIEETIDLAAFIGAEAIATHANRRNNHPLEAFLPELLDVYRRLGDYALTHASSVKLGADFRDHRLLGSLHDNGVINFPRLIRNLSNTPYTGLWILELEEPDREAALTQSRDYLASLTTTALI